MCKIPQKSRLSGRNVLFIVNPLSGNAIGEPLYWDVISPIVNKARIIPTVRFTQYRRHATELLRTEPLAQYEAIVFVAGDTTLIEASRGYGSAWERIASNSWNC